MVHLKIETFACRKAADEVGGGGWWWRDQRYGASLQK